MIRLYCNNAVSINARLYHDTIYWVTDEACSAFHAHCCSKLNLIQQMIQLYLLLVEWRCHCVIAYSCCSHSLCDTNFCLTSTLCTGNCSISSADITYVASNSKCIDKLIVYLIHNLFRNLITMKHLPSHFKLFFAHMIHDGRHHTAWATSWGCNYVSARRSILLWHSNTIWFDK